ncbi:hypothetical protein IEQ34_017836 [Dendrobium chrysotoxum]|uniref:Cytochrome f n=1 Tax=Dendrobium chrysotoxum TaxID=161865 RepID=A0AAV7GD76_DENCH|nr:hypothetical protein IEQ34_017836 [Dendrobium chrysotoxum]
MSSSDRIELFIDPGTWEPMDEDMVSTDPIEFHSEEEPYIDRISFYQRKTGLTEAVQTGVGEKITRLIEYATNRSLHVIIVCASGGARMQEGSLSLMQMAKISSASYDYQSKKKLFYVSILTSPTTGGVTASFGMLGDIIIAEPNAYIAFAANKPVDIEVPQAVLPNTVFEAVVRIPYDMQLKQVLANGPIPGQKYSEIVFPILSPDPATKKDVHFLKYPIYVGGNRGRGQIYPDGSKSNNTVYNATTAGIVSRIVRKEKGGYEITIVDASEGCQVVDIIPPGPELLVSEGESIKLDQPLTSNPNVGGFGQGDAEIVLQDPLRVQGLLLFLASVILAQIFLVLKKKQFEKVQLYEMNF